MGCFNSKVSTAEQGRKNNHNQELSMRSMRSAKNSLRLDTSDPNTSIKTLTFRHIMSDPLGRSFFMLFLRKEHAEENLIFYESVETVKKVESSQLAQAANELVSSYLVPGVETEVNISDAMKKNLIAMAESDVVARQEEFMKQLERAQNEIMMILAMGAFPRFLKSPYFIQYKMKVRENRDTTEEATVRSPERA